MRGQKDSSFFIKRVSLGSSCDLLSCYNDRLHKHEMLHACCTPVARLLHACCTMLHAKGILLLTPVTI